MDCAESHELRTILMLGSSSDGSIAQIVVPGPWRLSASWWLYFNAMAGMFAKLKDLVVSPDTPRQALGHAWNSLIAWVAAAVATAVAAAVVGGLLLYSNVAHELASTPPSSPGTTNTTLDFPGYFTTLDQLADRFNERQEFLRSLKGKRVRWRGYVSYVRDSDRSPLQIALAITPTLSDTLRMALVYFGADMRVRLYALREKDSVEITGTFDSEDWHTPYIQGDTMRLLAAATAELGSQASAPPVKGSQVQ
jgi:hypothetical protein